MTHKSVDMLVVAGWRSCTYWMFFRLYNLQVDDQADVDWDEVAGSMG